MKIDRPWLGSGLAPFLLAAEKRMRSPDLAPGAAFVKGESGSAA